MENFLKENYKIIYVIHRCLFRIVDSLSALGALIGTCGLVILLALSSDSNEDWMRILGIILMLLSFILVIEAYIIKKMLKSFLIFKENTEYSIDLKDEELEKIKNKWNKMKR